MSQYTQTILDGANAQGLSPEDVRALGYMDILAMAGLDLGRDDPSPDDFFYEAERAVVVQMLADQVNADAEQAVADAVAQVCSDAGFSDEVVTAISTKTGVDVAKNQNFRPTPKPFDPGPVRAG